MSEFFHQLESNKKEDVETAKQKILELFGNVKDAWLLNGLYEYYLNTNSANIIMILVHVREPHQNFLFDRLSDSITKSNKIDVKVQALTLLGHVVMAQPMWLYRLPEHHLLKDVLKLLKVSNKVEVEILPLISALLVLIVLIPMVPYAMGDLLSEVFDIFSRLASWNCNPGRQGDDQMIHMQVALYALFLRLYGMFPCNFLSHLRTQYKDKNRPVFVHTIKPMLETVKMNPSLVTTSKDNETASERWKKMSPHDLIVECERFSLDVSDNYCAHDSCQLASGFRSRSGTANAALESSYLQSLKSLAATMVTNNERGEFFSPSMVFNSHTPPISGVSISSYVSPHPEFTHDENIVPPAGSSPPEAAIEATPDSTPVIREATISNVAQSPIKKEKSPFSFNVEPQKVDDKLLVGTASFLKSPPSPGGMRLKSPTTPLRIKTEFEGKISPTKSSSSSAGPDEEIMSIERRSESHQPTLKQSDSVLHESEDSTSDHMEEDRSSPCTAGGLHMPNSRSMKDFAKRVQRLRHHSQCNPEPEHHGMLGGDSPELGDGGKVRRANSCPEMKKSPVSSIKDNVSRTLDETDEETCMERAESAMSNGIDVSSEVGGLKMASTETQTENFWPMPYEHMFLAIFPTLGTSEVKNSQGSGQVTANVSQEKTYSPSIYENLDKYVEATIQGDERDNVRHLKNQLKLVQQQLIFERHRREIHAFKNRRFLADAKNTQVLEEHNSALRDQVQLQQTDIDNLRRQLEKFHKEKDIDKERLSKIIESLTTQCTEMDGANQALKLVEEDKQREIKDCKSETLALAIEKQKIEASLFDALAEVKFAKDQALVGERRRLELEFTNKQLLMLGELQLKYKERLDEVESLRRYDAELELFREATSKELRIVHHKLREKATKSEAYMGKISELEQLVQQHEEAMTVQKRTLNTVNEEHDEKLKAVESKYQTQMAICRSLEERILDLLRQQEALKNKKPIKSPDTSSCQEVQAPSDRASGGAAGVSERSSPLSVSLASSDGSSALAQTDLRELKGLQSLVDEESPDAKLDDMGPSTSSFSKHD